MCVLSRAARFELKLPELSEPPASEVQSTLLFCCGFKSLIVCCGLEFFYEHTAQRFIPN